MNNIILIIQIYVQRRCDIAQRTQDHFRWRHIVDTKPEETNKENHAGNGKEHGGLRESYLFFAKVYL
jgi:hypothetical protein